MTSGKGLTELLERVQAFEGDDDSLDGDIFNALIGVDAADAKEWYGGGGSILYSIDRVMSLVEHKLPGLVIKATKVGDGTGFWQVQEAWTDDGDIVDEWSPLDPRPGALAFLEVLLIALSGEE